MNTHRCIAMLLACTVIAAAGRSSLQAQAIVADSVQEAKIIAHFKAADEQAVNAKLAALKNKANDAALRAKLLARIEEQRHETVMFQISLINGGSASSPVRTPGYGYGYDFNPRTNRYEFGFRWR